jgi:phosphomethylpyrimidine synthase
VLSPDEIHKLASKTRKAVGAETGHKASCHSDYVDDAAAQTMQDERLELVSISTDTP